MLHRNVIFRSTTAPDVIASAVELNNRPERLWDWLERSCTGDCQALSIPHNTNFGWGVALDTKNSDGTPFTKGGLLRRARTEPLIAIFQMKGNSECAPGLGTADEQCAFEQLFEACKPGEDAFCALPRDYVRNALKTGLVLGDQFGVNPFQYGFIADTDTHSSNPGATEERRELGYSTPVKDDAPLNKDFPINRGAFNPGGLAGLWAEQNTRESIFDALKRRETFATSGTRIRVRLFAGWNYPMASTNGKTSCRRPTRAGFRWAASFMARTEELRGWWYGRSRIPTAPTCKRYRLSKAGPRAQRLSRKFLTSPARMVGSPTCDRTNARTTAPRSA
jgi:Protein of unknown function (DUF3604)